MANKKNKKKKTTTSKKANANKKKSPVKQSAKKTVTKNQPQKKKSSSTNPKTNQTTPKKSKENLQKITNISETSVKELVKQHDAKNKNSKSNDKVNKTSNKTTLSKEPKVTTKNRQKSNAKSIARTKNSQLLTRIKKLQRKIKIYGIESVISKKAIAIMGSALLIFLILIIGIKSINHDSYSLDLTSISKDIDQLKTVSFDINESNNIINESKSYTNLKEYYEYDFQEFNLNSAWLEEQILKYNKDNKQLYFAFKPKENCEDEIKDAINTFLQSNSINAEYLEYDGYQFFINSSNNKLVISKIKQTQVRVFDILQDLRKADIKTEFGIDSKLYKEATAKTSMLISNTTCYIIIKPNSKSSAKKIDNLMTNYFNSLETKWQEKGNIENYNLVKNRKAINYNGYLIYVVSRDNDLVLQLIKK